MALSYKQIAVIQFAHSNNGTIIKKQAMTLIDDYYYNGAKHVGDILSRMVNAGLLIRESPGKFKIGTGTISKEGIINPNQITLF